MRVLVTGSRDWRDRFEVGRVLHDLVKDVGAVQPVLLQGDCPTGADYFAKTWWSRVFGARYVESYPALWSTYGQTAGYVRNRQMVDADPDVVVAFHRPCTKPRCQRRDVHGSHGTQDCIDRARVKGLPVLYHQEGWPQMGTATRAL